MSPKQVFAAGKRCPHCPKVIDPSARTCPNHRPQIWKQGRPA